MSIDTLNLDLQGLKLVLDVLGGIVILIGAVLTAFWAYTKFVLERGFLPPAKFYINCEKIGTEPDGILLNLHIENLGSTRK